MSFHHKHHHHRRQPNALGNVLNNDITRLNDGVERVESNVATLVSVVYVTATPTFNGPVAGYTTIVPVSAVQASTTESPAPAASTAAAETSALAIFSALAQSFSSQSTSIDVALITTATTAQVAASSLSLVDSVPVTTFSAFSPSSTLSSTSSILVSAAVPASATSSLGSAGVTQDSAGLAGGAKAGIAIAVLLAVLSLLALLGFCYRRKRTRRNEAYAVTGNEKNPFGDRAAAPVLARASTPSQLSLRPQDELAMPAAIDNTRRSKDLEKAQARVEHSANPFGPHAEVSQVNQEIPAPLRIRTTTPESVPLAAEAGIVAATASATVAQRHNAPKALDIKRAVSPIPHIPIGSAMPSPSGTEYSMTSVAAGTMASGPPPANVYRIQLDFKPSMEDELELNAGQLVRLLHEYDDGWVSSLLHSFRKSDLGPNHETGALHPFGSIPAGCGSAHMPFCAPCQASF